VLCLTNQLLYCTVPNGSVAVLYCSGELMVVVFLTIRIVHELICIVLRFYWNISMGSKIKMQGEEIRII